MRSLIIVFGAPLLKDDLRFEQAAEEFAVEALAAQLVMEALDVAVLPGAAWFDGERLDLRCRQPVLDGIGDEFWSVVAPQMFGFAVAGKRRFYDRDHVFGSDRPTRMSSKTHAAALVDEGQDTKVAAVLGLVVHKVPAPHAVDVGGALPLGGGEAHALATTLSAADLEAFPTTETLHAFSVDLLARTP